METQDGASKTLILGANAMIYSDDEKAEVTDEDKNHRRLWKLKQNMET